jgi:hypothetical protein
MISLFHSIPSLLASSNCKLSPPFLTNFAIIAWLSASQGPTSNFPGNSGRCHILPCPSQWPRMTSELSIEADL